MCRLYGFRSAIDSTVHRSLVAAENAIARQSRMHKDGWGLAFYIGRYPHILRNDAQAEGDTLFRDVSSVVATRTFMAHIRKATAGSVRVLNCHPFQHGAWTFAHNGQVCGFKDPAVRARVEALVDPRYQRFVLGDTDSELIFYAFLSRLSRRVEDLHNPGVTADHTLAALQETVAGVLDAGAGDEVDPDLPTKLNFLITNGSVMVAYRYRVSLFYSTHKSHCPERETCFAFDQKRCESAVTDGIVNHLLISSEVIEGGNNVWEEVPEDTYVAVDHGMNFRMGRLVGIDPPQGAASCG
jgi:glutamine amidotransferase